MTQAKDSQRKGFQDSVGIEQYNGKYRLNLARKHSRTYYGVNQRRISTGLTICKENEGKVEQTAWAIHYDILSGNFDPTLVKYGLVEPPNLTVVETIKPKQLSILEIYDRYVQSREGEVAVTTLELQLKGKFKRAIVRAIEGTDESALAIKEFLLKNGNREIAKSCLRHLEKAYQLGIEHSYVIKNPFTGMASKIKLNKGRSKAIDNYDSDNEDSDTRAFTIDEMNAIIEAFESSGHRRHLAPIIKFLFWTGCRTGEAIGLIWRDVQWDKERIHIRRTYNSELKTFKATKTDRGRYFPMPKDSQLWNLLKSLPERELNDVVFSSKQGKIIYNANLHRIWQGVKYLDRQGVIPELIEQGKVSQYLKLYATRHTFISHQVNIHKIPITTVAQWVGNGAMVANNSYLDRDRITVPGYSNTEKQQPTNDNQQMNDFVASLTPEQRERFKTLLTDK